MRLSRPTTRHLICLTSLLAFVSTPLLAQTGIDLLDPEQVLRAGESPVQSNGATTVRATLADTPTGLTQATHVRDTLQFDDGMFENFADDGAHLEPVAGTDLVEWAQRFQIEAASSLVSATVCFLRPENDLSRSLDFNLRFYRNVVENRISNPGRRSGLTYIIESSIRRAGDDSCVLLRGHLVGKPLSRGTYWVGIEWNRATLKRLGGDHYTRDDEADTDRNGNAVHETEVRYRTLPVPPDTDFDGWLDPRGDRAQTASGIKAIGVRLVVERTHGTEPDPTPDPTPTPDPPPGPDADPGVIVPPPTGAGYSACRPTVAPLTLEGDIKVSLCYQAPNGDMDDASAVYRSDNSGLLYFFEPDNAEVFVKVLDGCGINRHRWVYVAPLTDVAFNMYINDGRNPTWTYFNKAGDQGEIRANLMAFPCAP